MGWYGQSRVFESMIEIKQLHKVVQGITVLELESLRVRSGEIAGVFGPSGSGVDELFRLLLGQSRPTAGSIRLHASDPAGDRDSISRTIGVLFSEDGLYQSKTAASNLAFHARLYGLDRKRVGQVLHEVGLDDQGDVRASDLPTGLARRLALGRAILHDPPILILRDPFARCDQASITLIGHLIRELAEARKAILILADDDAHLPQLCHALYRMSEGHLVKVDQAAAGDEHDMPFKIPVRGGGSITLVNPAEVLFATAEDGKAALQTTDGDLLNTQYTLSELEGRLLRRGFFRAHRSYLVNLQHVTEVIPFTRDSFSLRLDDDAGTLIPLSKTAAAELRELLDY